MGTPSQQDTVQSVLSKSCWFRPFSDLEQKKTALKMDVIDFVDRSFMQNQLINEGRRRLHFKSFFFFFPVSPGSDLGSVSTLGHQFGPSQCLLWLAHQIFFSNLRSSLLILLNSASYKEVRPLSAQRNKCDL